MVSMRTSWAGDGSSNVLDRALSRDSSVASNAIHELQLNSDFSNLVRIVRSGTSDNLRYQAIHAIENIDSQKTTTVLIDELEVENSIVLFGGTETQLMHAHLKKEMAICISKRLKIAMPDEIDRKAILQFIKRCRDESAAKN